MIRDRLPAPLRTVAGATKRWVVPPPSAQLLALFDAGFYVQRYPEVGRMGLRPLEHYRSWGRAQGRSPNLLFDVSYYRERYRPPGDDVLDLLRNDARSPHPLFDSAYYLRRYPGVAESGINPLVHYLLHGVSEGRLTRDVQRFGLNAEPVWLRDWVAGIEAPTRRQTVQTRVREILELAATYGLVTVDLWDTLVVRTRPADASKLAACERLGRRLGIDTIDEPWQLYELRTSIEHEIAKATASTEGGWGEYELVDVYRRMLQALHVGEEVVTATALAEEEIVDEVSHTRVVTGANELLAALRAARVPVALLSDFYVGAEGLRQLAEGVGLRLDGIDVFVSCEMGCSKSAGDAFQVVRDALRVPAGAGHLHIGDNATSDGSRAEAAGCVAVLVDRPTSGAEPGALRHAPPDVLGRPLRDSLAVAAGLLRRESAAVEHPLLSRDQVYAARLAGTILAPAAVALVTAAVGDAIRLGLRSVHYLSREGHVFRDVHRAIASIVSDRPVAARHLAVSRLSTFGPSLASTDTASLMRLWTMYPDQSPAALLNSLGLDPSRFDSHLRVHGLGRDESVPAVFADARVRKFLDDPAVERLMAHELAAARSLVVDYLRAEVARDDDRPDVVVVDIGWRGTIQDNLAHLMPEWQWHGWYLALFPFLNPQPMNTLKRAVGPDANRGDDPGWIEPVHALELAMSSQSPSTARYRFDGRRVVPVFAESTGGPPIARALAAELQAGLLGAARSVAAVFASHGGATWLTRPAIEDILRNIASDPPTGLADLVFESEHDETFGVLNDLPHATGRPDKSWLAYASTAEALRALEERSQQSRWPQGHRRWTPVANLRAALGDTTP